MREDACDKISPPLRRQPYAFNYIKKKGESGPQPTGNMIMLNGTVMRKDGSRIVLKEGDRMDMNGDIKIHTKANPKKTHQAPE